MCPSLLSTDGFPEIAVRIWLLTGGRLFIGQLIDLFLIPGMIRFKNLETALIAQALQAPR